MYDNLEVPYADTTILDDLAPAANPLVVTWKIDAMLEDASPAAEAARIWRHDFGRTGRPTNEDCCVFTVTEPRTGRSVEIDLSDDAYAHLFTD